MNPTSSHTQLRSPRGRAPMRRSFGHRETPRIVPKKANDIIPPLGDNVRIIPLGGVEEVGKNMTVVEYGDDIVIIDMGFQFKDGDTPGVDYILPNTKYLEDRKDRIRGVVITHGHLDHIGGIPYIMDRIGNPPVYTRLLTSILINKRQEEFPHMPKLDLKIVEKEETITLGKLKVEFFTVTHTIPDAMGVMIHTPYGMVVTPGDVKLDHFDGVPTDAEVKEYDKFKDRNVLCLLLESTNVDNPGFSTPERVVHENLEEIIKGIKGRLVIGTFASLLERVIKIIEIAEKYGKKIVIEGRSMKSNVEIVRHIGMLKVKPDTIIPSEDMVNYAPDRIVVLATGAQGDEFAALMRMSNKTHKYFKITPRDTILLSSSIIPGNEKAVQKLKDNLSRQGAKIIHYRSSDVYVHSSGHGNRGELEWLHRKINPKFFMPLHGSHYMLRMHEDLVKSVIGMPEGNVIVPDNGTILEVQEQGQKFVRLKESAPNENVTVDGFSIGNIQEMVIRDRKMLAQDGIFVVVVSVNARTGKLKKSPDIISRGTVYLRESQDLLSSARMVIKKSVESTTQGMNPINFDYVKSNLADDIGRFLFQKTAKKPIVIPVILGV